MKKTKFGNWPLSYKRSNFLALSSLTFFVHQLTDYFFRTSMAFSRYFQLTSNFSTNAGWISITPVLFRIISGVVTDFFFRALFGRDATLPYISAVLLDVKAVFICQKKKKISATSFSRFLSKILRVNYPAMKKVFKNICRSGLTLKRKLTTHV